MLSTPSAPEVQNIGGLDPKRLDSSQLGRVLPWHIGRHWFPVFWCVQKVYNFRPTTTTSGGGKGGKGATTTSKATCDVAGVVACCAEDYIEAIRINGEIVWSGGIERDGSHPEHSGDIVVPNVGTFRFHWGTETASGDFLILNSIGEEHPYYRSMPVLEAKALNCGSSGSVPNIEVLPERSGKFAGLDQDRSREGANPITGLAELLGDDFFGLGMPDIVDVATGADVCALLAGRTKTVAVPGDPTHTAYMAYLSIYVDERQTFGSLLAAVMENFDGFVRRTGDKLEFGLFEHVASEPAGLLELTLHDFVEEPKFPNPGTDDPDVITDTIVKGPDRDWEMQDSWQTGGNDVVRDRLQETRQKTFDRRFICTSYQQKEQAHELAMFYGVAAKDSSHTFRRAKVGNLRPGDRFVVNYGPSSSRRVFRVNRRTDPPRGGEVELSIIPDRGIAPLAFIPPADPAPARPLPPVASVITSARMFTMPFDWAGSPAPALIPLASRPAYATSGFRLHFSESDTTYDPMIEVHQFAAAATTVGSLSTGTTTFTIASTSLDIGLLQPQSATAAADDTLLLFAGNEVMSIGAVTALGGGQYSVTVLRSRLGSATATYGSGTVVYILPRVMCEEVRHAQFPRTAATKYFKLQALTRTGEQDLSAALKITFTFADTRPAAPTGITALPYAGYNVIVWNAPASGVPADEYHVYRGTTSNPALASWIGDTRDLLFHDAEVVAGAGWYYFVSSEDLDDVEGPKSGWDYCVALPAPITPITPSDPSAITLSDSTSAITADGRTICTLVLSVPGKPSNAEWVDVLYRENISGDWLKVGKQRSASTSTFRLDDLSPAKAYQVASRSRNPGAASNVVQATGAPFTTSSGPTPSAPTSLVASVAAADLNRVPVFYAGSGGAKYDGCMAKWTASTSRNVAYYEIWRDAGVPGYLGRTHGTETEYPLYSGLQINTATDTLKVRAISTDGTPSSYASLFPVTTSSNYGTGNLAEQNRTAIDVAGGKAIIGGLEANIAAAVDVKAVHLRIFDSGGAQRLRVDNTTGAIYNNFAKVVGARKTGWTAPTGTRSRAAFDPSTVTTEELAKRVAALLDDAGASSGHGLIDA